MRAAALLLALALAACAPQQRVPIALQPTASRGQQLYMTHCQQCHPGGAGGLGPSLNDKPLPGAAVALQVRLGFGAMPAFSHDEIDNDELTLIVGYVLEMHKRAKPR